MKNALLSATIMLLGCGGTTASSAPPVIPAAGPGAEPAPEPTESDACEELATVCHGHDQGNTLVNECHILGHDGDAAVCDARHAECMAACQQAAGEHAH